MSTRNGFERRLFWLGQQIGGIHCNFSRNWVRVFPAFRKDDGVVKVQN